MPTYLSEEKLKELKEELDKRKKITRHEIAERISAAKELGDLSENFEYHEAKDAQGANEMKISQLESMIIDAQIVQQKSGGNTIQLGSSFEVEINGDVKTFQIVGASEANPLEGKISNESPIGSMFLGACAGKIVEVEVPSGIVKYKVLRVL
jgi:transcription elongation factor GreA